MRSLILILSEHLVSSSQGHPHSVLRAGHYHYKEGRKIVQMKELARGAAAAGDRRPLKLRPVSKAHVSVHFQTKESTQ